MDVQGSDGGTRAHVRLVLTYDLLVDEPRLARSLGLGPAAPAVPATDGVNGPVDVLARGLPVLQAPGVVVLHTAHEATTLGRVDVGPDAEHGMVTDDRGGWGPVLRRLARGLLSWD